MQNVVIHITTHTAFPIVICSGCTLGKKKKATSLIDCAEEILQKATILTHIFVSSQKTWNDFGCMERMAMTRDGNGLLFFFFLILNNCDKVTYIATIKEDCFFPERIKIYKLFSCSVYTKYCVINRHFRQWKLYKKGTHVLRQLDRVST